MKHPIARIRRGGRRVRLCPTLSGYDEIVAMSAPIAGVQLAQVALTSIDLAMLGLLGVDAVAAGGLAILLYNQIRTMCVGMVTGVGNLIATEVSAAERHCGSGLDDRARARVRMLVRSSLLVGTLVATVGAVVLCGVGMALPLLGQRPTVVAGARAMMFALAGGLFPMVWLNVLRQFAVGMRRPGSLLLVTIISIGVNALCNAAFIYGWAGLPRLGAAGVGLSTTLVQVFTCVVFAMIVRRDRRLRPLVSLAAWRAEGRVVGRIARHGAPISMTYGSEAALTSIATLMMGGFGPVMLAASNVANQLAYIVYQVNIGLSQGSSILVSRALGKDEASAAPRLVRRALTCSWVFMAVVSISYVAIPHAMLWPFLHGDVGPHVLHIASLLLIFAVVQQYSKGTQNILVGLLRGLGTTVPAMRNAFVGYWLVGMPVMVVCAYGFGWGGWGVWSGLCAGFAATAALLAWRLRTEVRALLSSVTDASSKGSSRPFSDISANHATNDHGEHDD